MVETEIALVGVGGTRWQNDLLAVYETKRAVYTDWTFRLGDFEKTLLEKQLKQNGKFRLMFYEPKSRGGDMMIGLVGHVTEMAASHEAGLECPEPALVPPGYRITNARTWLKVTYFEKLVKRLSLDELWSYRTRRRVTPSHLRNAFAYVVDAKDMITEPVPSDEEDGWFEIVLDERYIEDELAANPEILRLGELELIDRQRVTPSGRPDLIFRHKEYDLTLIVELKKYEITSADVSQAERYLRWGKNEFGANTICLLVGHSAADEAIPKLDSLKKAEAGVYALVYEALFRVV